jgi:hypothetical protein
MKNNNIYQFVIWNKKELFYNNIAIVSSFNKNKGESL